MNENGALALMKGKAKLGADASIAAGHSTMIFPW